MINYKNVSKALKNEVPIFWFRSGDFNYLFTGHWGLRTTKNLYIEKGIFTTLINTFKTIPDKESGCEINYGDKKQISIMPAEKVQRFIKLLEVPEKSIDLEYTNLIQIDWDKEISILKSPKKYIYLDRKFANFIEMNSDVKIQGSSPVSPVYFSNSCDKEIAMLLPLRFSNESTYLKQEEEI